MTDHRPEPPRTGGEREMLDSWLDFHRETLLIKCEGLSAEQLKQASVPPSNLTLLGLVRHMSEVERGWFHRLAGTDGTWIYCTDDDLDGDFDNVADADADADLAILRREIDLYRAKLADVSVDAIMVGRRGGKEIEFNLRWILTHMIEEYARHNGHADLLREAIDGTTGS